MTEEEKLEVELNAVLSSNYYAKLSDGSVWALPVSIIALHHANMYKSEQEEQIDFLYSGTLPHFNAAPEFIKAHARDMLWSEIQPDLVKITEPKLGYQQEWVDAEVIIK